MRTTNTTTRSNTARTAYRHVISLGYFCSTALELERRGLRDASYPFDWVICPIRPTLELIESRFEGLLKLSSLRRDSVHPSVVHDDAAGIDFYHDFDLHHDLATQIESARAKYARRVARFYEAAKEPTLFVRYIANEDEFAFMHQNMTSVLRLLRTGNQSNDLLLVGNSVLSDACGGLTVFRVDADLGDDVARSFVSRNAELTRVLRTLRYPLWTRLHNRLRYLRSAHFRDDASSWIRPKLSAVLGEDRLRRVTRAARQTAHRKSDGGGDADHEHDSI